MTLTVTDGERRGWTVFQVEGEMDLVSSPAVRQRVHAAVADGRRRVVLDLSQVKFCDSSGIGVLIASRRLMRSCNGGLRLVMPEEGAHVNRVFAALGVRSLFDIYRELETAVDDEAEPVDLLA
ncbi:STAS domain-containing protein [Wenjunlia tyrosinilytica]|uniref:Anti-sigma factor antagonist n=1 Tax=Wenjunlia tyrosinilytica TaxID=1544741 RepID=A0A918DXN0_9ACTN|nr:STAS domain-containing protein [Wenjunlia tyrosinilytica]GGO86849.1 anti-sigma factor antagonist [Wenjunlia tyrosinilytica]